MHGHLWRRWQVHQLKWARLIRLGLLAQYPVLRVLGHLKDRGVLIDLIQLLVELVLALLAFDHSSRLAKLSYGASAAKRLNATLVEHLATWSVERLVEGGVRVARRGVGVPLRAVPGHEHDPVDVPANLTFLPFDGIGVKFIIEISLIQIVAALNI